MLKIFIISLLLPSLKNSIHFQQCLDQAFITHMLLSLRKHFPDAWEQVEPGVMGKVGVAMAELGQCSQERHRLETGGV